MRTKDRLTLEQLRAEQCYLELTPKQKVLVDTFIATNGDRVASVLAAYSTKSKENAQIMAYTVLSSPRVVALRSMSASWTGSSGAGQYVFPTGSHSSRLALLSRLTPA